MSLSPYEPTRNELPAVTSRDDRLTAPVHLRLVDPVPGDATTRRTARSRPGTARSMRSGTAGDAVKQTELFAALDELSAERLRSCLVELPVDRGQVIFGEGTTGDCLYLIAHGTVKLGRRSGDGRVSLLDLLGPGEMFGELSVFDPGPRTATATAVSPGLVCSLSRAQLEPWLLEYPALCDALLRRLSARLRRSNRTTTDLVFHDIPGRLAMVLLDLADAFGEIRDHRIHIAHGLTQQELAQLVGSSRETLNKILSDWTGRGWLQPAQRAITLIDVHAIGIRARRG